MQCKRRRQLVFLPASLSFTVNLGMSALGLGFSVERGEAIAGENGYELIN
jgi:hypothetical protein